MAFRLCYQCYWCYFIFWLLLLLLLSVRHILQCIFLYSIRSPHTFCLMYNVHQNAILNALKSTQSTQTMGWYHDIFEHIFSFFLLLLRLLLPYNFFCVFPSLSHSQPPSHSLPHIYMCSWVCLCVCVILLYTENSYSIFFSPRLRFSFILDRAPRFILHIFVCAHNAHRYIRLYALCFTLIFFSALFSFTCFVVISFLSPLFFSLLLLLLLMHVWSFI